MIFLEEDKITVVMLGCIQLLKNKISLPPPVVLCLCNMTLPIMSVCIRKSGIGTVHLEGTSTRDRLVASSQSHQNLILFFCKVARAIALRGSGKSLTPNLSGKWKKYLRDLILKKYKTVRKDQNKQLSLILLQT